MSSFNRRQFCALGLGFLAMGCGFTPVYGPGGGGAALIDAVAVDAPKTRQDYLFVRTMEERLGRGSNPRYGLSYKIDFGEEAVAISSSNVTTRYNVIGRVTYALRDLQTGEVAASGKTQSFTSYSASGSTVATQAARDDAGERLMIILADDVTTRLGAALTAPAS
ncbi:LPS assembly lipoprotein LptE [Roseovarius nubinhibens]|uniref:Lipoprotein n=1 Tax=Roseovarius nubinhibens TaxID=314263 RepID=A0A348WEZ9_9RHOB|nr:hypothetical protein [Roseovarius nubinhibens]|tara:strand:+ start:3278 stop:3772 length:495 start_codon:yes stop_codon:yes gene_type:complete